MVKGLNATRRGVDIVSAYEDGGGTICPAGLYPFSRVFPNLFVQTIFSFLIIPINISELVFLRSKFGTPWSYSFPFHII